ncbi:hypothetical protein COBT_004201, partial [Conglomerata obtusa]
MFRNMNFNIFSQPKSAFASNEFRKIITDISHHENCIKVFHRFKNGNLKIEKDAENIIEKEEQIYHAVNPFVEQAIGSKDKRMNVEIKDNTCYLKTENICCFDDNKYFRPVHNESCSKDINERIKKYVENRTEVSNKTYHNLKNVKKLQIDTAYKKKLEIIIGNYHLML